MDKFKVLFLDKMFFDAFDLCELTDKSKEDLNKFLRETKSKIVVVPNQLVNTIAINGFQELFNINGIQGEIIGIVECGFTKEKWIETYVNSFPGNVNITNWFTANVKVVSTSSFEVDFGDQDIDKSIKSMNR